MLELLPILATYCLLIALASVAGGAFPILARLSHTGMQISISFVGGVMLGVGMLHMLPHAAALTSNTNASRWMLIGFVIMFFLQRFSHFHHHEPPMEGELEGAGQGGSSADHGHAHVHAHAHQHNHGACDGSHSPTHHQHHHDAGAPGTISWTSFALGLGVHSLMDGVALAASVHAEPGHRLAGLATFLAILLHKPFDSLTITLLMASRGASIQARQIVNLSFALVVPLGVMLFMGSVYSGVTGQQFTGPALAFAAGVFVCIAASDLLPEVQFHSHDRLQLSFALLAGIFLAGCIELTHSHVR